MRITYNRILQRILYRKKVIHRIHYLSTKASITEVMKFWDKVFSTKKLLFFYTQLRNYTISFRNMFFSTVYNFLHRRLQHFFVKKKIIKTVSRLTELQKKNNRLDWIRNLINCSGRDLQIHFLSCHTEKEQLMRHWI